MKKIKKIAVFASGSGTNAERIIEHFNKTFDKKVTLVVTNNPRAYVMKRARRLSVPCIVFTRSDLVENNRVMEILEEFGIDFIVLAGFLWLIPLKIIKAYPNRIINIHPALLPKYGGKGMYGMHVHEAVLQNHDSVSGITIHYVNEEYDSGDIIFQATCPVYPDDTPEILARRVHQLEYEHYPIVIGEVIDRLS